MKILLANAVSLIFHPIVLLIIVPFIGLYKLNQNYLQAALWTWYNLSFLSVITIFIMIMVRKGVFSNMDVSKREQRPLLYGVSAVMMLFYVYGLYYYHSPKLLYSIAIGLVLGIIVGSIINTRLKVSIHVSTVTALIFSMSVVFGGWYYLGLILIPIMIWARVVLRRHTIPETIVGALMGILLSVGVYWIYHTFIVWR